MYTIIGGDKNEYGPVSEEQIRQWISEGRVDATTRIKRQGEDIWKSLAEFSEFGLTANPDPQKVSLPPLINFNFFDFQARVLQRYESLDAASCVGRSWNLVKKHLGISVGAAFLFMLISGVISSIPAVGSLINFVLQGVFLGGLYWLFLRLKREGTAEIGDLFAGFQRSAVQLSLGSIVSGTLTMLVAGAISLPFLLSFFIGIFGKIGEIEHASPDKLALLFSGMGILGIIGIILAVLVSIFLSMLWMFAIPLIIDKEIGFWQAMELSRKVAIKQIFPFILLMILNIGVVLLGILACCVGLLVAMPVCVGAYVYAYEDLFNFSDTQAS